MSLRKFIFVTSAFFRLTCPLFDQLACQQLANQPSVSRALGKGVVVELVKANDEGTKAGLQPGDVILAWSRGLAGGEIATPFDWLALEVEQRPRGKITLTGLRGVEERHWVIGLDAWGVDVRPSFSPAFLALYREGQELAAAGRMEAAEERWQLLLSNAGQHGSAWLAPFLPLHVAQSLTGADQGKATDDLYVLAGQRGTELDPAIKAQLFRKRAEDHRNRDDWAGAEPYYLLALQESQKADNKSLATAQLLTDVGTARYAANDRGQARRYLEQARAIVNSIAPESLLSAAILNRTCDVARAQGELPAAEELCRQALTIAERLAPDSLALSESYDSQGELALARNDLPKAKKYHGEALRIREQLAPNTLPHAQTLSRLGLVYWVSGDLDKAEFYFKQALEIRKQITPGGMAVANGLNNLGNIATRRGKLAEAEVFYRGGLEIREKLAPGTLWVAASLIGLGSVADDQGKFAQAEEFYLQALAIQQKLSPEGSGAANTLNNLGLVQREQGKLREAEASFRHSLDIKEKLTPGSENLASTITNLGLIYRDYGDLTRAEEFYRHGLEIFEKISPERSEPVTLGLLGEVAYLRNDLDRAQSYFTKALSLQEKTLPNSLEMADTFIYLGTVKQSLREWDAAESYYRRGLEIYNRQAPGSLNTAVTMHDLSRLALDRGDLASAERLQRQALDCLKNIAAGGVYAELMFNQMGDVLLARGDTKEAENFYRHADAIGTPLGTARSEHVHTLAGLARIAEKDSRFDAAAQLFEQSLQALEAQVGQLGGAEAARTAFRAAKSHYLSEYIDLLVTQGKPAPAFQVLERSRARSLLETLAEARIDVRQGVEGALLEQERQLRAEIAAKSNWRARLLGGEGVAELKAVNQEIADLTAHYQEVEAQIRNTSPAYAALTQPEVLSASGVQRLLDRDSMLLEYSLGHERSYVFAVKMDSLHVFELPPRAVIEKEARAAYRLLTQSQHEIKGEPAVQRETRRAIGRKRFAGVAEVLSQMLLRPVLPELQSRRLIIVSDGALQYIPFAVLPETERPDRSGRHRLLLERHEIINLPSASVLAVLRRRAAGRRRPEKSVAVLADPVFSKNDPRVMVHSHQPATNRPDRTADVSSSVERLNRSATEISAGRDAKFYLRRLPFSRQEARAILAATPRGEGMMALDFRASRDLAMSPALAEYRIVHFATHGLVDSDHPELSGLVLSLVGRDGSSTNGFFALQDIYNLDLPADLVVLSACQTGLGKEAAGEGLIGLTRGFMHGGATAVVASLWSTDDAATAELMKRFYRGMMADHLPPSAALRRAQIEMHRRTRWKDPYYWAAFVIQGDWG